MMLSSMASKPFGRMAIGAFVLLWIFFAFALLGGQKEWYSGSVDKFKEWTSTSYSSLNNATEFPNEDDAEQDEELQNELEESMEGSATASPPPEKPMQSPPKSVLEESEDEVPEQTQSKTTSQATSTVVAMSFPPSEQAAKPTGEPASSSEDDPVEAFATGSNSSLPISYQLDVPPKVGCESLVQDLQLRLITEYRKLLKGVRYANIWGYLG